MEGSLLVELVHLEIYAILEVEEVFRLTIVRFCAEFDVEGWDDSMETDSERVGCLGFDMRIGGDPDVGRHGEG